MQSPSDTAGLDSGARRLASPFRPLASGLEAQASWDGAAKNVVAARAIANVLPEILLFFIL